MKGVTQSLLWLNDVPLVFGDAAALRQDLVDWSHRVQMVLPPTEPIIFGFKVIHLDSLLAAITRGAYTGDVGHALRVAKALIDYDIECDPALAHRVHAKDEAAARHYLRHRAARAWESRLRQAIARHEILVRSIESLQPAAPTASGQSGAAARIEANAALILDALERAGFNPQLLPAPRPGMADPVKAQARALLEESRIGSSAFDHAWKHLIRMGLISRTTGRTAG